jgi:hypothetical protein
MDLGQREMTPNLLSAVVRQSLGVDDDSVQALQALLDLEGRLNYQAPSVQRPPAAERLEWERHRRGLLAVCHERFLYERRTEAVIADVMSGARQVVRGAFQEYWRDGDQLMERIIRALALYEQAVTERHAPWPR